MILGILLGLLSAMLLISLAVSVIIYVKFNEINMHMQEFRRQLEVFRMFKEQTLVEITQLKMGTVANLPEESESLTPEEIKKINDAQNLAFEMEYLKALEAKSL